jgi:DNA-binding IclR family transcriptional regulator
MSDSPVSKAMAVLRTLAEKENVGVSAIAAATSLNVSTVHRLLRQMTDDNMVAYDPHLRTYSIGTAAVQFATQVLASGSPIGRVRPIIVALANELAETCAFTIYEPKTFSKIVTIVEHGPQPLGYAFEIGSRDGIHAGASGTPIAAFLPDDEIEKMLQRPLEQLTEFTITDPDALRRKFRLIRKNGYAMSRGERVPGAGVGVGAPVFNRYGRVIGSVVVTIPAFRWKKDRLPRVEKLVRQAAEKASLVGDPSPSRGMPS